MEADTGGDATPILIDDAQGARGKSGKDSFIEVPDGNWKILRPASTAEPAEGVEPVVNRSNPGLGQIPVLPGSTVFPRPQLHTVKILYLFAGKQRKGDIAYWFHKLKEKYGCEIEIDEVDIERDARFNLQNSELQWQYRQDLQQYNVAIVTPPCNSFSRLQWSSFNGPAPVRDKNWPRGFPWLDPQGKKRAEIGNDLVDFTFALAHDVAHYGAHGKQQILFLGEHPEDLGTCPRGTPGSMFDWDEFKSLESDAKFISVALHQSDFGAPTAKPTRFWGNFNGLAEMGIQQPLSFDEWGYYLGPLPKPTQKQKTTLVRQKGDTEFRSGASAAYPSKLCEKIVDILLRSALEVLDGKQVVTNWKQPGAVPTGWGALLYAPKPAARKGMAKKVGPTKRDADGNSKSAGDEMAQDNDVQANDSSSSDGGEPWADNQKLGQGWQGQGLPIAVRQGRKWRTMQDGGGLCSPGRWGPAYRPAKNEAAAVCKEILDECMYAPSDEEVKKWIIGLSLSRFEDNPLKDFVVQCKAKFEYFARELGFRRRHEYDPKRVIDLELLQ